jgi:hypothetical protein
VALALLRCGCTVRDVASYLRCRPASGRGAAALNDGGLLRALCLLLDRALFELLIAERSVGRKLTPQSRDFLPHPNHAGILFGIAS